MQHMDSKECADYIGVHINTLRKYVHEEGLPVLKFPGRRKWTFRKDLVDAWIYERSQPELVIKASDPTVKRKDDNEGYGKIRVLMP